MCCRAAFNLEKVVVGVFVKMKLIKAEQLAGLMPSTSFQRRESLSDLSFLEKIEVFRTAMESLGSIPTNKFFEGQPEHPVLWW